MILAGSKAMVDTVIAFAENVGVPSMVISATIVAFGTSVPELAVSIAGVLKKCGDLAIGNIVGSCTFNILLILGLCALVSPLGIQSGITGMINVLMMLPAGAFLTFFMILGKGKLGRMAGIFFLAVYMVFLCFNCRGLF